MGKCQREAVKAVTQTVPPTRHLRIGPRKTFFFFFQWSNAEALETDVVPITLASWPQTIYLTSRGPFPLLEKAEEANLAKGL